MWTVRAVENDYYPDIRFLGVFHTREAAEAFAAKQPKEVSLYGAWKKSEYDYHVEEVPVEPTEPWWSPEKQSDYKSA